MVPTPVDQLRRLQVGVAATAAMAVVSWLIWGPRAGMATMLLGWLATGIQMLAPRMVRRWAPDRSNVTRTYAVGMALRVVGVMVLGVLITIDRGMFPPGPAALGYLGALLPLLWLETRLA